MPKRTKPVSVTELRQNAGRVLRRACGSNQPIVVTEKGKPQAVLLSLSAYGDLRSDRERALLRSILRGRREIQAGRSHSVDEVLSDLQKVLSRAPK
jgi:prevent-host-death family protein